MAVCRYWLMAACLWTAGCGGSGAFGSSFPDNRDADINAVLARLREAPAATDRPMVLGVRTDPGEAFAYDLAGQRLLWKQPAQPASAPYLAGDLAVIAEEGRVTVRSLETGAAVAELPSGDMHLMGAHGDGDLAAVVMSTGGSMGARSRLVILRGGQVTFSDEVDEALGAPAVRAGMVFVPWSNINLSVLTPQGVELSRVRVTNAVLSRARVANGEVYFGQNGVFQFDEKVSNGTKEHATYYEPPLERRLPGNPSFLLPGNKPPAAANSAVHSVRLAWQPAPSSKGAPITLANDSLVLLFYKLVFAMDPTAKQARWIYQHAADVVGLGPSTDGLLVVDNKGGLAWVRGGFAQWTGDMGMAPTVAAVRSQGFSPGSGSDEAADLSQQLLDAASNPDARLVPARALAVSMLASDEAPGATRYLVELCRQRSAPARVRNAACAALAQRSSGADAVSDALAQHADYLRDVPPPPVGPLAQAAMRMGERSVVPALLAHLQDPATADEDLPPLMLALTKLADESAVKPVQQFVRTYHAEAQPAGLQEALLLALELLGKLQKEGATEWLGALANDRLSIPEVRGKASRVLAELEQQAAAQANADAGKGETEDGTGAAPDDPDNPDTSDNTEDDNAIPERITHSHLVKALKPVQGKMRECVRRDKSHPTSGRLTIVLDGEGDVVMVRTLPESLQECLEPLVLSVPFPANRYRRRQQLTYQVTR